MPGGLIQLIAIGAQDAYLTNKPEITFFKTVYRRHTNFAIETVEDVFMNGTGFDKLITCEIQRKGDLLSNVCLRIELPSLNTNENIEKNNGFFSWVNSIGHAIIDYVELEIGGRVIDKQYGEWMEIWSEFSQSSEKRLGYNEMIGKTENFRCQFTNPLSLYIPLNFWFCKNVGLALPLIALQYHNVKINIKFKEFNKCWVSKLCTPDNEKPINIDKLRASLLLDYVFLDLKERKRFAQQSHIYLIEQTQYNGNIEFPKANSIINIPLNFNHPIKEIFWVIQRHDVIDNNEKNNMWKNGNDTFNYSNFKNNNSYILETFDTMCLLINGQQRFPELPSKYFRLLQSYYHHTRIPSNYIYCYSFAIKPEEYQPTGTCNFSRLDNVTLRIIKNKPYVVKEVEQSDYSVRIYCNNYNVLMITGGLSGIMFSN
jgi:hypothetical protein